MKNFRTFTPESLSPRQRHHYILGSVNPRPICFASTMDAEGHPNLAPYSFFNVFSSTPPVFIFSANTRRDGSNKDTLANAKATGEVVINLVNHDMAGQMAICGVEYATGVNEFIKGGFTPIPSETVKPFRVKESPVQFECKVLEVKTLSDKPGAANLVIAQANLIHMHEDIFADDDTIDPLKIDMVGRLGNFNYARAFSDSIFAIKQPPAEIAIGFDNLPGHLKNSHILTGNQLAMLAGVTQLPSQEQANEFGRLPDIQRWTDMLKGNHKENISMTHQKVKDYLKNNDVSSAWKIVILAQSKGVI